MAENRLYFMTSRESDLPPAAWNCGHFSKVWHFWAAGVFFFCELFRADLKPYVAFSRGCTRFGANYPFKSCVDRLKLASNGCLLRRMPSETCCCRFPCFIACPVSYAVEMSAYAVRKFSKKIFPPAAGSVV